MGCVIYRTRQGWGGEEPAEGDGAPDKLLPRAHPDPVWSLKPVGRLLKLKLPLQGRELASRAAVTNYHKRGSLKQKYIVSILEPEVRNQGVMG